MDARASSRQRTEISRRGLVLGLAAVVIVLASVATVVVAAQVQVTEPDVDVTRTCGSVFDSLADRSGWEIWWARDLDEGDPAVRAALVRTTGCPDAINLRLAVGATLVGLAAVVAFALWATQRQHRASADTGVGERLLRLGRVTSFVGAALTIGGLAALVLLIADADSTLFLYTDRLVVGVVGLIVLVPTVALHVTGRALMILGASGGPTDASRDPVAEITGTEGTDA
jgi:hypothetical protein